MTKEFVRRDIQRGYGNEQRPVTKILWDRDSRPKDIAMSEPGNWEPERRHVDFARYYDPAYAEQEIQKLWLKAWLFACREEDIPNVGDRLPFEVGRLSFIIVRSSENEIKAFYNSCLHRGTKLCSAKENSRTIRCPYHAWEWNVDGRLKAIPSHWDFSSINRTNGSLREVKVGRWGGFVYINADAESRSFEEALGPVPEHFKPFDMENRYTAARFRKLAQGNWKICQEAFMESYHVLATHPAAVPYNGDSQTQYDIWTADGGHVGRQVTPSAVPSMHAPGDANSLTAAEVFAIIMTQWHYPEAEMPTLNPEGNLRAQIAQWHREVFQKQYGVSRETATDAMMIDSSLYFIFPHSTLWFAEALPFTYAFTPHPTDPERCYFDVRMLLPVAEGQERPPAAEPIEVGEHERIQDKAKAFGFLAEVFDQDMANMKLIQAGMKASDPVRPYSLLGTYQEMILQHWNDVIDQYMAA